MLCFFHHWWRLFDHGEVRGKAYRSRDEARSRDPPPSLAATHWRGNCRTYGSKSSVGSSIRDLPGALALRTAPGRTETGLQARKANPGKGRLCRASPAGTATLITMTFERVS